MSRVANHLGWQGSGGLLEREQELERLQGALEDAAGGRGRAVVIVGGAGLGKSSLLELVRERCRQLELGVLSARGEALEATLPWSLARQLLVPAVARALPKNRRALLSGAAAPAAGLLGHGSLPVGGETQLALVHALFWVIAGIAERSPIALLVDDAHWGDEPSLRLLAYLARRLADLPAALIVARRPGAAPGLPQPLEEVAADPATDLAQLAPLSPVAAGRLARETLGPSAPAELIDACVQATAGNPFYLQELLRAVRASPAETVRPETVRALVPAGVSRSVFIRLSGLGSRAAALARAAAVLGDRAALPRAAGLAGLNLEEAAGALDQLAAAEILAPGEPLRFVHQLVAAAIHDDLPPAERASWHLRAARLLDQAGVESALLAPHLLAAGARADPWVVDQLQAAAAAAAAQGAVAAAARYLARALEEPPPREARPGLLAELGRLEGTLGRPSAPGRLRAALELTGPGEQRVRLLLELGRALVVAGHHGEAARAFESGMGELESTDSELARELRAAWWMAASIDPVERARVLAAGDPEINDDRHELTLGQRQLLAQLALERAFAGRPPEELRALAERAWGGGALLAGETSEGLTWSLVAGTLLSADALEAELEVCDAVIADARRRGSPMAYATASYCRAWPLLRRGDINGAIADAQAAVDARGDGWQMFLPMAAACLAFGQLERGARAAASAALALAEETPELERSSQYPMVLIARGRLLIAEGQFEAAIATQRRAGELLAAIGFDNPTIFPWQTDAARAAALAGDLEQSRAIAERALERARRTRVPVTIACALRAMAAATGGGRAIEHLREALARLPEQHRLEQVYVLVELGAALRRANQRAEATAILTRAHTLAATGGATALADRARTELAAAGVRPGRRPTGEGPEALTPGERRVAELAAGGHTNREIAQLLFVTDKTVEYHLGNAYRKLGINRRTQLARAFGARHDIGTRHDIGARTRARDQIV